MKQVHSTLLIPKEGRISSERIELSRNFRVVNRVDSAKRISDIDEVRAPRSKSWKKKFHFASKSPNTMRALKKQFTEL